MQGKVRDWLKKRQVILQFSLLLLISLIIVFVSRPFYRNEMTGAGFYITTLFDRAASESGEKVEVIGDQLLSRKQMKKKIQLLEEKVESLEQLIASSADKDNRVFLNNKNNADLNLINQNEDYLSFNAVSADIMARNPDPFSDSLIISAGSYKNIKNNQAVVAVTDNQVALVGRIVLVTPWSASIRPIYHSRSSIGSRLKKERYEGILKGQGDPSRPLDLSYLNKNAQKILNSGDVVITSGLSSIYPAGIDIGRISTIKRNILGPVLDLEVIPLVNFDKLETVYVLTEKSE